jgi:WD40 repeat protein
VLWQDANAGLPGCNADDEGENDRSLTASDIKPDRSTGTRCQIECRLIQLSPLLREFKGHAGSLRSAAFSPDGARIVTASQDGTARVWERRDPAEEISCHPRPSFGDHYYSSCPDPSRTTFSQRLASLRVNVFAVSCHPVRGDQFLCFAQCHPSSAY